MRGGPRRWHKEDVCALSKHCGSKLSVPKEKEVGWTHLCQELTFLASDLSLYFANSTLRIWLQYCCKDRWLLTGVLEGRFEPRQLGHGDPLLQPFMGIGEWARHLPRLWSFCYFSPKAILLWTKSCCEVPCSSSSGSVMQDFHHSTSFILFLIGAGSQPR